MRTPGTPPGMKAMNIASRNQNGLIPKNSPNPPQTPAMILSFFDLRKDCLCNCIFTPLQENTHDALKSRAPDLRGIMPLLYWQAGRENMDLTICRYAGSSTRLSLVNLGIDE